MNRIGRTALAVLAGAAVAAGLGGCSAAAAKPTPAPTRSHAAGAPALPQGTGPVTVLYAGSLVSLMQNQVGPGFTKATGYTVQGVSAGSDALAQQIKAGTQKADVFISAAPAVNAELMGKANGDWVSWYAQYATSPLLIGYNPQSSFVAQLKSKPWYDVVGQNGFRLGSTDAQTDPKGALADQALKDAATKHDQPALTTLANGFETVQPEESLVARLQAGQLDAAFLYRSEAVPAKIPTVPLTGENLEAKYTITILNTAPDRQPALAFVEYFLGAQGRAALTANDYTLPAAPTVTGAGVPSALKKGVLSAG